MKCPLSKGGLGRRCLWETGMHNYPRAAVERMMKVQEVILRAMAKKITWWQAAEIMGMSDRNMRRLHWRYREHGYDGLMDRRGGPASSKRVALAVVEQVFTLYREKYFDLNVRHFHEKLQQEHGIGLSYTWVKQALQGAGLVRVAGRRGVHRRRRERRPLPGMLLHIDGSRHQWFQDDRWYDLLVILDDATSEIYYAQLVQEESTMTVLRALREVIEQRGIFCALYSDRASHFFWTPRAGGKVDAGRPTQVGRAPQELRLQGIGTLEQANQFLREHYVAEFNRGFQVGALQRGSAFLPCTRKDLDVVFSVQQQRVVNRDNTVVVGGTVFQIEPTRWRGTLAGCAVTVCEHLDQLWSIRYGPHLVGRYNAQGWPWLCEQKLNRRGKAVEKPLRGNPKAGFPLRLQIPQRARDSHFPTASTAVHRP